MRMDLETMKIVFSLVLNQRGYVIENTDCDDENDGIYPTAEELCDGVDENCDEIIDNDAINEF